MAKAKANRVLIIDDERSIRRTLGEILEYEGYEVEEAADGMEGMVKIKTSKFDVVFCDIKMPKMDGMEVLENASRIRPELPIIMISGHGTVETAVDAVRKGAFDYIAKPLDLNRLLITVRNALDKSSLISETKVLRQQKVAHTPEIIGETEVMQEIKKKIETVGPTDARILITGANGTGKEMVARWIHKKSDRSNAPFIEVNCAAIPSELIESELFGHEKGSFTSAHKQRIGKFEQANGGTLFLDEIGDMSHPAQAKVLRALQENRITRVGGDKDIQVDVRILAATNKNLLSEVEEKKFRLDLYHRLNVIPIHVPSLNDRRSDIPLLANHFVEEICQGYGTKPKPIDSEALELLKGFNWTGNVRELRNVMERLIILSGDSIKSNDVAAYVIPPSINTSGAVGRGDFSIDYDSFPSFQDYKEHTERKFLTHKLEKNGWNISKTAEDMGIQRSHLYAKMEKYDLKRN